MSTESEVKLARYSETAKETDELGRIIGVRRLKPSEHTKLAGMTAELVGYDEMTNEQGEQVRISHRMPMVLAASVCLINDAHIPFPRNRGELDAVYDRLDMEGLKAAGVAFVRLNENEADSVDNTKNLSGTPSSA